MHKVVLINILFIVGITGNGTDISLAVTCSNFAPVVSYHATGVVPGSGRIVSIGYTCTNSTGAVVSQLAHSI